MFILYNPTYAVAESQTIQQQIDAASPGDTIELEHGEYIEHMVINKPIHLIGVGDVTFIQRHTEPIITIEADHVVLENFKVTYTNDNSDSPAILINGDHNGLRQIEIHTNSFGIQLDGANDNKLSHITITGSKSELLKNRKHGIDLSDSHNNEIHDTHIKHVQDGMYIEKSHGNKIYQNTVSHSRYGFHLMFTKGTVLNENESSKNVSGMYIMGDEGTTVKHNTLRDNQANIQSLGLLLFDTSDAIIAENKIINNRIGVLIESASENILRLNQIQGNYIGIQFKRAEHNDIIHNSFIANVVQGQAKESSNNQTNENYWGDHVGLDLTGDHTSDLIYKVDPFFLNVTNAFPSFQLLFQSPGMVFLEQLIHTPVDEQLIDVSPLMSNPLVIDNDLSVNQLTILLFCLCLLMISILIIYLGVRKNEKI